MNDAHEDTHTSFTLPGVDLSASQGAVSDGTTGV
jgi:hypothetical protein